MARFIKFIIYSALTLFTIFAFCIIFLSQVGFETKKFNSLIIEEVKNYNEDVNLEIEKVKIYLSLKNLSNPKLRIKTTNPSLSIDKIEIELNFIETKIDIFSYFKNNFVLEKFEISTKDNKIKDIISIAALENPSLIVYNLFIKKGFANLNGFLKFDENGKIVDYKINGEIKNAKLRYDKKHSFGNISSEFIYHKDKIIIKNANFDYNKIKFLSNKTDIAFNDKGRIIVKGDIETKKNTINSKLLKNIIENDLSFIKDQDITFKIKNQFSFIIKDKKIKSLKHSSEINLDNLALSFENKLLKNYFTNYKNFVSLKNNSIKLIYEKNNLNIEGESEYSFDKSYDKIEYKIRKKKNTYDFLTIISFDHNPIEIKTINYSKEKNKKSFLKIEGFYNNEQIKFGEIIYKENKNYFKVKDLNFDKNFKILDLNNIKVDYLNKNNNKNEFTINKDANSYNLSGKSFDSYTLINDILISDNDKSFLDNFNLKDKTVLNINLNKIFLDKNNSSKNLLGKIVIKNNDIYNLVLNSSFENGGTFKIDIQTKNNNNKTTLFYSDYAEPFVKHYNFIKGFKGGKIDFYSVKEKNISNSTLNIFDFKVKEMPALTKLLSLASLQGIADLMTGEGIRFEEFEMNFNNKDELMTIDEIYAIGPAISILMDGYVENNKLISLRGTMVPATTINKIIGKIKILGEILVGKKKGEGVFGVSFKIKGPPKKLKTTVNPIKTLTPRFITRTLEKAKKKN